MTPKELRQVLDEHSLHERNKDSFFVISGCLIILTGMVGAALVRWVVRKRIKPSPTTWEV